MTEARSITSEIDVRVAPEEAFRIFTEELDCWWLQGPINFHDSARTYAKQMEPGVSGRIMEVHDLETGDGLELGGITHWEPGLRVAWVSSIDDVATEVTFSPAPDGTRVCVTATIPPAGKDLGGTAWLRMTAVWLPRWIERRDHTAHAPLHMGRLAIAVHYEQPAAAGRWLRDTFGFDPAGIVPSSEGPKGQTWIEFHVGNCSIICLDREAAGSDPSPGPSHTPWIFVDDLEAHFEHSRAHDVQIVSPIASHGALTYVAADLEGNRWTFAQAGPYMRAPS